MKQEDHYIGNQIKNFSEQENNVDKDGLIILIQRKNMVIGQDNKTLNQLNQLNLRTENGPKLSNLFTDKGLNT